ncbi:MAG: RDD family protein [Terriglobales bacterium]
MLIDPDHYDPSEEIFSATLSTPAKTEPAVPAAPADAQFYRASDTEPQWRNEVTARVSNFRSRRRGPAASAHASMRFDFDSREAAPQVSHAELSALPRIEPEVAKIIAFPKALPELPERAVEEVVTSEPRIVEAHPEAHLEAHPEAPFETHPAAHAEAHFESQAEAHPEANVEEAMVSEGELAVDWEQTLVTQLEALPVFTERLADPVVDESLGQVLEADPELALPMLTPLADIALDAPATEAVEDRSFDLLEDDVALSLAPVFDRAIAGAIDAVVANAATLMFMGVFTVLAKPAMERSSLLVLSTVVGVFTWTLYQYIFLVHRGQSLGMQFAQLEICTFDGERAWRTERRRRVWGLALSCASMGLGFVWALMDEDRLGWHDRITRSCLVRKEQD